MVVCWGSYNKILCVVYKVSSREVNNMQFSWFSSSLSLRKWESVFLAIGSLLGNCQICLKMFVSICCCTGVEIGNKLLRKVTLERMGVFKVLFFLSRKGVFLKVVVVIFLYAIDIYMHWFSAERS